MGIKRFFKKGLLPVPGHLLDAYQKQKDTGKPYLRCLKDSVKETFTEDLPGTSHVYQMGKTDGRKQGTIEQAERDEAKMQEMHEEHEHEREKWKESDKEKDNLIDDLAQMCYNNNCEHEASQDEENKKNQ